MSQYDKPLTFNFKYSAVNFAVGGTQKIPLPRGARYARVCDILLVSSVTFTQVTTPALVQVGDGTTPDKFASITVGALAAGSTLSGNDVAPAHVWKDNYVANPVIHDLVVTFVAPTGGTPAGTADVCILLAFDQVNT